MNKVIISIVAFILVGLGLLFLSTGGVRTDAHIINYDFSEDGKTMTIKVGVFSSAGFIRDMKQTNESDKCYLTFYSTYGINSRLGAKDTFTLDIDQGVDEIYIFRGDNGYSKVLEKNIKTGEWEFVKQ